MLRLPGRALRKRWQRRGKGMYWSATVFLESGPACVTHSSAAEILAAARTDRCISLGLDLPLMASAKREVLFLAISAARFCAAGFRTACILAVAIRLLALYTGNILSNLRDAAF